jgi:hypothetical protein
MRFSFMTATLFAVALSACGGGNSGSGNGNNQPTATTASDTEIIAISNPAMIFLGMFGCKNPRNLGGYQHQAAMFSSIFQHRRSGIRQNRTMRTR